MYYPFTKWSTLRSCSTLFRGFRAPPCVATRRFTDLVWEMILFYPESFPWVDQNKFICYLVNNPHTYMEIIEHRDRVPYSMKM